MRLDAWVAVRIMPRQYTLHQRHTLRRLRQCLGEWALLPTEAVLQSLELIWASGCSSTTP
jgi:hypothetical protein